MGFAVTASHLVFAISLLTAGSAAVAGYWKINEGIEDAERAEAARAVETANTHIAILATPTYSPGSQRVDFDVKNTGSTVLQISGFSYIIDGALTTNIASGYPTVPGAAGTDYLLPGETMTVRITSVTTSPANLAAVTENGIAAYWSA